MKREFDDLSLDEKKEFLFFKHLYLIAYFLIIIFITIFSIWLSGLLGYSIIGRIIFVVLCIFVNLTILKYSEKKYDFKKLYNIDKE